MKVWGVLVTLAEKLFALLKMEEVLISVCKVLVTEKFWVLKVEEFLAKVEGFVVKVLRSLLKTLMLFLKVLKTFVKVVGFLVRLVVELDRVKVFEHLVFEDTNLLACVHKSY